MNNLLIAVTMISVAVSLAIGVVLARVVRAERRRSEARVAALREMAGLAAREDSEAAVEDSVLPTDVGVPVPSIHVESPVAVPSSLFMVAESSSPWPRRAGIAALLACAFFVAAAAATWAPAAADGAQAPEESGLAAGATAAPLDLLSLHHTRLSDELTVSGVVRNPLGRASLADLSATVYLFSPDGTLLASGRAPLETPVLRGGDRSPFAVSVAVRGSVSRYRIGFRAPDGRVIAHVDRRAAGPLARSD
ncbi:MAG TPA: hypothetical protein VLD67_15275 [Vicinamibacterales bacterium]|nr:hypothetical protein [Vicinamibacterales bacterium]